MTPLDSADLLTVRLGPTLGLHDLSPNAWDIPLGAQERDWGPPGVHADASAYASMIQELSNLDQVSFPSSASYFLTTADQGDLDATFGMNGYLPTAAGLGPSFSTSDDRPPFPPLVSVPNYSRCTCLGPENCLGSVFTDVPETGRISNADDEVAGYISSSAPFATPRTLPPCPQTLYMDKVTEESFGISSSYKFPAVNTESRCLESVDEAAFLNNISPSDLTAWIDDSSDFGDFDFRHFIVPEEPVNYCEWTDENGAVCGEKLTAASLPGHLSAHGIKSMSRDRPTMCKWVGCKRRKPVNRESIVRHVREVHLGLRRPSKRAQEPYS